MIENIKIVSDGTSTGTAVYLPSGEKLRGVISINIDPLESGGLVIAHIAFAGVALDLVANKKDAE